MYHPLDFIPDKTRKPLFIALLIWTLILFAIFRPLSAPLTTSAAPSGIVSFELARTPENAQAMVASWDGRAQLFAAFGLGFDYLFMLSYAFAIALACLLAAGRHPGAFAKIGAWLGWGARFHDCLSLPAGGGTPSGRVRQNRRVAGLGRVPRRALRRRREYRPVELAARPGRRDLAAGLVLVRDVQIRPDPARHPLRAGGLVLAEEAELNE